MAKKLLIILSLFFCAFAPLSVFAQDAFGIQAAGQGTALGGQNLILTVTRIISVALVFLGILAVGIVLYAGYLYMTAAGNEDQVSRAKRMLINGAIGLAIILSSYAIAQFVVSRLSQATGAGGGTVSANCADPNYAAANPRRCSPGGFDCSANRTCCTAERFVVLSLTPSAGAAPGVPTGMNNIRPRTIFSQGVDAAISETQVFQISRGGVDVTSEFSFSFVNGDRRIVEAVPTAGLLAAAGSYTLTVLDTVRGPNGAAIQQNAPCGFFPQTASFTVDTTGVSDTVPPAPTPIRINGAPATNAALPRGRTYAIASDITDGNGVGYVRLRMIRESDNTVVASYDGPPVARGSAAPTNNPYAYVYTLVLPSNAPVLERYRIELTVFDIDNNQATLQGSYVVVGEGCTNGVQDGDETDIDFGGSCLGNGQCTADWQCFSGQCDTANGICIAAPVIRDVSSWDGAGGNWVTIEGRYFGEGAGEVSFGYDRDQNNQIDNAEWIPASLAQCGAEDVWRDQYVIAEVPVSDTILPPGSRSAIRIVRGDDPTLVDTTINALGPVPGPAAGFFIKNNTQRPGLCSISPLSGVPDTDVTVRGNGLGTSQSGSTILFGGIQARATAWSDAVIQTTVPRNMSPGRIAVSVNIGGQSSNGIPFRVLGAGQNLLPVIQSIDPGDATRRSLVTIYGQRFGETIGRVYFAPNAGATCPGDPGCILIGPVSDALCGDTWSDTQIVIEVPDAAAIATHAVIVENAAGFQSDGSASLSVRAGGPLPGICRVAPDTGPAPLPPQSTGLVIAGRNFTTATNVYFWTVGADANDLTTWLAASGPPEILDRNVVGDADAIRTLIPTSGNGYSMQTGPIRVRSAAGQSNSVRYTVSDCRESPPDALPGYQCCSATGQWRDDAFVCPGETREAGYGYRFTTGRIPRLPYVTEDCPAPLPSGAVAFPSPTPWRGEAAAPRPQGEATCVNAAIAVRFSTGMNAGTLIPANLRLFTCGTGSEPDCNNATDVSAEIQPMYAGGVFYLRQVPPAADLLANTWYRAVLLNGIESQEVVTVLGVDRIVNEPLLHTRPCGSFNRQESAYCFEFKTGTAGNRCSLTGVGIQPPLHTVRALGPLLDPRYPAGNTIPFYYHLWGRGSQECTVIAVDGLGWQWSTANASQATVGRAPGNGFTDTRATGDARSPTAPGSVEVRADATVNNQAYRGISFLTIDIGDPEVSAFWPNCQDACVNATVGVRFNRPMFVPDLAPNIRLYGCPDETCYPNGAAGNAQALQRQVPVAVTTANTLVLEASPQAALQPNAWYQVEVVGVRAIGGFDANGNPIPGRTLTPFYAKFRTKADGAFCTASRVVVEPDPFVAHSIGEKTVYTALPLGSPDLCSPVGQRLSPWDFGWNWSTADPMVASVTNFAFYGRPKSYCTAECLVAGSDVSRQNRAAFGGLCGNAVVDPGEDCDIARAGEVPGVSCSLRCVRPGASTASCGNGTVEPLQGEECDTNDTATRDFCAADCTWRGSSTDPLPPGDVTSPRCGSGQVTNGEDCEVGLGGEASATCSAACLHLGTSLAQEWCDRNGGANVPECRSAISICGNDVLEADEECEVVNNIVEVMTPIAVSGAPQTFGTAQTDIRPASCSDRCILTGNICGTNASSPIRCTPGTEGCTANCTLAGASAGYVVSSVCTDGVVGTGEFSWCEYTADEVNVGLIPGQNPAQAVTAVGLGTVDPATRAQSTIVRSSAVAERQDNAPPVGIALPPEGMGDYALQCGYTEYPAPVTVTQNNAQVTRYNDCANTSQGVGTNSCCYDRPIRTASLPEDGAGIPGGPTGDVCRNALLSVTFDGEIAEATLVGNILIAEGHTDPAYDCAAAGERDVTTLVSGTLARENSGTRGGFFGRLWEMIRTFVLNVFGRPVSASAYTANTIRVWCSGGVRSTPEVRDISLAVGGAMTTSTIIDLPIDAPLDANTMYALLLRGGADGLKDVRGVGIRRADPSVAGLDDSIIFETGSDICKIAAVTVRPVAHVYTAPNTPQTFIATASSTNDQAIVPIPNAYAWDWSWGPRGHAVFDVPPDTDRTIIVRSRTVEGSGTLVANATITADADPQNNHVGRTFSASAELTALFCENPWPAGAYYPYEDGNPQGRIVNNDGYNNGFDGSELPPIMVGGGRVYFNFSMGYCADAGTGGDTSDDLPYLHPLILGNLASGGGGVRTIAPRRIGRYTNSALRQPSDVAVIPGYAFIPSPAPQADIVQVVDVSNPVLPRLAATIAHNPGRGIFMDNPSVVEIVEHPNGRTYLVVLSSGSQPAISIFDVTNPVQPVHVSSFFTAPTPTASRYVPLAIVFSADARRAYVGFRNPTGPAGNAYRDDALAIMNMDDFANPRLIVMRTQFELSQAFGGGRTYAANPSVLALAGDHLYVASRLNFTGYPALYRVANDQIVYVNYGDPNAVFVEQAGREMADMTVNQQGNVLYALTLQHGLRIVDVSNPAAPRRMGTFDPATNPDAVNLVRGANLVVANGIAFVGSNGPVGGPVIPRLSAVDVSNPTAPVFLGRTPDGVPSAGVTGVAARGSTVYVSVTTPAEGMEIFDASFQGAAGSGATISGALKQFLFTNDQNDDAIGMQVFDNTTPLRFSAVTEPTRIAQAAGFAIVNPVAGDVWPISTQQTIRWSGGDPRWQISLNLVDPNDPSNVRIPLTGINPSNDGSETVTIPSWVAPLQYRVGIQCAGSAICTPAASGIITVVDPSQSAPKFQVTSPAAAGNDVFEGMTRVVQWSGGDSAWSVQISLMDESSNQIEVVLASATPNDGSASVRFPSSVNPADPAGSPYTIVIQCVQNCPAGPVPSGLSNTFNIFPVFRVQEPASGVTWNAGVANTVRWTGGRMNWGVTLNLFSIASGRNVFTFPIGSNVNDGSESVTIPAVTFSGPYRINISCENDPNCQSGGLQAHEFSDSAQFTVSGAAPPAGPPGIPPPAPPRPGELPPPAGIGPPSGNDDVRLSAREWYTRRFGPVPARFRSVTIDGYDALTDGNTYYVNVLNEAANGEIFHNIIVLSMNPDAQAPTRAVFDALLNSLRFNINMTDFGYCSVGDGSQNANDVNVPDAAASVQCTTDFDCTNVGGRARICAAARTKLQRDVDRLEDIRQAQKGIENYRAANSAYPTLQSGTFIPGYTTSRWPSWGRLGALVGALATDPVNSWIGCGANDPQTCWDPALSEFLCPAMSQVYEYRSQDTGTNYVLYSPFEYLTGGRAIVADMVDRSHFADAQYCIPAVRYSPFAAACGDSVVNTSIGEECDPPGAVGTSATGIRADGSQGQCGAGERATVACSASCRLSYGQCETSCGNGIVDAGEACDDGARNGSYGSCNTSCTGPFPQYCGNVSPANPNGTLDRPAEFCEKAQNIYDTTGFCLKQSCRGLRYTATNEQQAGGPGFNGSHFINTSTGWAVGSSRIYAYAGTAWAQQANITGMSFWDVFFLNPSVGWAVGGNATSPALVRTTDGGRTWSGVLSVPGAAGVLTSAYFLDERVGFAVGSQGGMVAQTTDAGITWTRQSVATVALNDIQFVNQTTGWIVGAGGTILKTINGGGSWLRQTSGSAADLQAVYFLNTRVGWVVGRSNTVLTTVDGGTTWTSALGTPALTGGDFFDVVFVTDRIGLLASFNGRLYTTNDGGATWTLQTVATPFGFTDISMVSTIRGWVVGNGGGIIELNPDSYCAVITDCSSNAPCQNNDQCVAIQDASYHARNPILAQGNQGSSCALDCQGPGGFCGDGIRQPQYEECDDANANDTDECGNFCFARAGAAAPVQTSGGSCGDSVVEGGEVCDLGADNGIACDPEYGRSCTYCSEFCTQVLTVDPTAYCGNGTVDQTGTDARGNSTYEVCDTNPQTGVVSSRDANGQAVQNQCADQGQYTCANSCSALLNNCISCGLQSLSQGGAVPQIAVLNPMVGNAAIVAGSGHARWANNRLRTTLFRGISPPALTNIAKSLGASYRSFQALLDPAREVGGIETNLQCSPYYVRFNVTPLPSALCVSGCGGRGDYFPYSVAEEQGVVQRETLLVPIVPGSSANSDAAVFRIVVRWTDEEQNRGGQFSGMLYNEAFSGIGASKIVGYARALSDPTDMVCEDLSEVQSTRGFFYWWPAGCQAAGYENSILVHPIGGLTRISTQAMTITAGSGSVGLANGNPQNNRNTNYAFFVDAIGQPMNIYRNSNLRVEVYAARAGQDAATRNSSATLEDYYAPAATFDIRHVANTSLTAQDEYWHVFNIVRVRQQDGSYRYEISRFGPVDPNRPQDGGHGTIESGFQDVLNNIP